MPGASVNRSVSSAPIRGSMSSSNTSSNDTNEFSQKWRQTKACARCHRLKMKCAYDDPSFVSCKRCFLVGVECSQDYDPTSKNRVSRARKKRKTVEIPGFRDLSNYLGKLQVSNPDIDLQSDEEKNSHKASLIEDVNNLKNLKLQLISYISQIDHLVGQKESALQQLGEMSNLTSASNSAVLPLNSTTSQSFPIIPFEKNLVLECIKLNYLTISTVREKYQHFREQLLVYWPVISISDEYSVDYLVKHKPLLLLSFIVNCCATSNDVSLYNVLSYYLDMSLSHRIFINGNLSIDVIQSYLVLSLWNPPPKQWGTFKHQLHLLTSLNLHWVVDLRTKCEHILLDNDGRDQLSLQENEIVRLYLMIYASCGSLGLSLPKFKCISWNTTHHLACNYLYEKSINPTVFDNSDRSDIFIYYISKLVCIGQEMTNQLDVLSSSDNPTQLHSLMDKYEEQLLKLMLDYRLTDPHSNSRENSLVGLTYQQILMSMYDHLIYKSLSSSLIFFVNNAFNKPKVVDSRYELYLLSIKVLEKLILVCKRLVETFLAVCDKTLNIPTFFNYRPMNAVISLIKAKILIKLLIYEFTYRSMKTTSAASVQDGLINDELMSDIKNLDFNLKSFFNHFYKKYEEYTKQSVTSEKMFAIVKKMKKLIKLVGSILNKKRPRSKTSVYLSPVESGISASDSVAHDESVIAGFKFKLQKGNPVSLNENLHQENNFTITTNLANNDLLSLLYELGKDKAVENIDYLELNPETKKQKRRARSQRKRQLLDAQKNRLEEISIDDIDDEDDDDDDDDSKDLVDNAKLIPTSQSSADGFQPENNEVTVTAFLKELFSSNVFSDMIDDNAPPTTEPLMATDYASTSYEPSAVANFSNNFGGQDGQAFPSDSDIQFDAVGENTSSKLNSINAFLSLSSDDMFNDVSLSSSVGEVAPAPMQPKTSSIAGSSTAGPDDYNTNMFWTNNEHEHDINVEGFNMELNL